MRVRTVVWLSVFGVISAIAAVARLTPPPAKAEPAPVSLARSPAEPEALPARVNLPGPVTLDARLGRGVLSASGARETHLLLRATTSGDFGASPPVHVVVLLDRSGSMRGRRAKNALEAARGLVERLRVDDRVTLMAYDVGVQTLIESTRIDEDSRRRVLERLVPGTQKGNTCISCALSAGISELERSAAPVKHVLLLSDGEATAGEKTLAAFQRIALGAREKGIGVSSIGIDLDYNEALLSTLARFSNGRHHFARTAADLRAAFDAEVAGLSGTVATNTRVEVELPADVQILEVFDREVERDGNHLRAQLGAMAAGDEKTLLLRVRLPEGGPRQALVASFSAEYVGSGGEPTRARGSVGARITDRADEVSEEDPIVAARVARSRTGALLFEVGKLFGSGAPDDFARADAKLGSELDRVTREKAEVGKRGGAAARSASDDLERQRVALDHARKTLRVTRGAHCGCAAGDLACAMRCTAAPTGGKARPACAPGDPLCANVGDLSPDEKAAAKGAVGASNPFMQ